jgi:hypothetical protein
MADTAAEATKQAERARQEKRELGHLTAVTLMEEMRFLGKLTNRTDNDDLIDIPKDRPDFQVIGGEHAAKSELAGDFLANTAGLRYCVADGEVGKIGLFDIDHTHAFSDIEKKQKALLVHLNDPANADFAEGFLSAGGIAQYFGKHPDGKIKGTRRFFKLCYNDIDNLLLLCHACNMHKSNKESLEWFGKQEPFLGGKFVKAVNDAGGLYDGIIVKKVMEKGADAHLVKIGGIDCTLHAGDKKVFGMGEFIKKWFEEKNPAYRDDIIKAYGNVWLSLKDIFETRLSREGEAAGQTKRQSGKLALVLEQSIKAVDDYYGITKKVTSSTSSPESSSQSSSDDEVARKSRLEILDNQVKAVFTQMHDIKKFYKTMASSARPVEISRQVVFNLLLDEDHGLYSLEKRNQQAALNEIKDQIMGLDASTRLDESVVKPIIEAAIHHHSTAFLIESKEIERQRADEAERQREAEEQARIKAEEKLAAKNRESEEKDALIARLMASQNASEKANLDGRNISLSPDHSSAANPHSTDHPQFNATRTRTSEHLGDADSKAKKAKTEGDKTDASPSRSRSPSPTRREGDH